MMREGMRAIYISYHKYAFLPTHKNIDSDKSKNNIGNLLRFVLHLNMVANADEAEEIIKWLSQWEK